MKYIIFVVLLTISAEVLSCGNKFPVDAVAKRSLGSEALTIVIKGPSRHENFRLGSAGYRKGENYIHMYQGYEESDVISYELRGTKEFFTGAVVDITYLAVDALCAYKETINLENIIKNCSNCDNDT